MKLTNNNIAFLAILLMCASLIFNTMLYQNTPIHVTGEAISSGYVNVCLNHPPVLDVFPSGLNISEGRNFTYDVNATHADDVIQNITFYDNTTLFNISPSTGIINFTAPGNGAGIYHILITVQDNSSCSNSNHTGTLILNITLSNVAPIITGYYPLENPAITEEQAQLFNTTYQDEDNDDLVVYWYLNNNLVSSFNDISNLLRSNYTFTGNYTSAGIYNVMVVVSDSLLNDSHSWILDVSNVNRPPYFIKSIKNQSWAEDTTLSGLDLDDYAYDPDTDDTLTYSANYLTDPHSIVISINSENTVTFSQPKDWYGIENISFTVTDNHGASNTSNNLTLTVYDVEEPSPTVIRQTGPEAPGRTQECIEQWLCAFWSVCYPDGYMERVCTDLTECGTEYYKPLEKQNCTYIPSCFNGIQDGGETGVDCGGPCGLCPTCFDGTMDNDETGIDCGGSCPPCPTCFDGIINGGEIGIDCGGACELQDCCFNGYRDAHIGEKGIDCGGSCKKCSIEIEKPAPKIVWWAILLVVLGIILFLLVIIYLNREKFKQLMIIVKRKFKKEEALHLVTIREELLSGISKLEKELESKSAELAWKDFLAALRLILIKLFDIKYEFTYKNVISVIEKSSLDNSIKPLFAGYIRRIIRIAYSGYEISKEEIILLKKELRIIINLINKSENEGQKKGEWVKEKASYGNDFDKFCISLAKSLMALEDNNLEEAKELLKSSKSIYDSLEPEDKKEAGNYIERAEKEIKLFEGRENLKDAKKEMSVIAASLILILFLGITDIFSGGTITGLVILGGNPLSVQPDSGFLAETGSFNIREGEHFIYMIKGYDTEQEGLLFSDDTDLFNISSQGIIEFTPSEDNIGIHHITLILKDSSFRTWFKDVVFNITEEDAGENAVPESIVAEVIHEEENSQPEEAPQQTEGTEESAVNATELPQEQPVQEQNLNESLQPLNESLGSESPLNEQEIIEPQPEEFILKPLGIYAKESGLDAQEELRLLVENNGSREIGDARFKITIKNNDGLVLIDTLSCTSVLAAHETKEIGALWNPANLSAGFYEGNLLLSYENKTFKTPITVNITSTEIKADIISITGLVTASGALENKSPLGHPPAWLIILTLLICIFILWIHPKKRGKAGQKGKKNKRAKRSAFFIFILVLFASFSIAVFADSPSFDNLPTKINVTEDSEFIFYVNATDADIPPDYPLAFSDDSEGKLSIFSMLPFNSSNDNRKAIISFTPAESDVLDSTKNLSKYHITIIVKDSTFATTAQDVLFNITNVNDPPNITSFTPAGMQVQENSTITFSFDNNTADPDLTHSGADYIINVWYFNGTNASANVSWSYSPGFCNASIYNITLMVNDSYKNSTQVTQLLTITNLNRPPVNNASVQNLTWQEDTNLTNNFTLSGFFNDTDKVECSGSNKDTLTYGYTSYEVSHSVNSSKRVTVSINQATGNVSFYVDKDWYGIEIIAFYANDSYNITYSNNITLNVTNTNDAPAINSIDNQTLIVGRLFTLQVNATEPDNDSLYFYTNSTLITINTTTGIINFTPVEGDIGNYSVNITINDTLLQDSRIAFFSIINNTAPVLDPIGDKNWTRSVLFQLNLTATDADGDNLTFTSNSTIFNITWYNRSMSKISFTPKFSDVGNHSINFIVLDPYGGSDSELITFMINDTNTAPALNRSIDNMTWHQNTNLIDNLTLSEYFHDPEGDTLTYNVTGNVNISIIINQTTSNVSFYPPAGWFGVEYVRFYANDSYYLTYSNNITLNVTENHAPLLYNIYPYGNWSSIIYNWTEPGLYPDGINLSPSENTTMEFRQNSSDPDSDALTYQWLLNGTLLNNTQNLTHYFNFTTAGMKNLTVKVSDGLNTTSFSWNLNITNINRQPTFGTKAYTAYSDFNGGTLDHTNITVQSGNITLAQSGSSYANGTYISPAINLGANSDKLNLTYIRWVSFLPAGTNITIKTRTASSSAGLSSAAWSRIYTNSAGSIINSTNNKFIQFMANLTTGDDTKTPVLEELSISYEIATPSLLEDYTYEDWIDLDNYFEDLDTDDSLVFNHSYTGSSVNIAIDQDDHTVTLSFTSNWYGTASFRFQANDSYSVIYSNNITITVQDVVDEGGTTTIIISSGGGGGGGATTTKIKKVSQYEYTRLLIPGSVSVVDLNKVKIPIILENTIDQPLRDIHLSATSEEGVSLEFDNSFISEIGLKGKKMVNLFATASGKDKPYIIKIMAQVTTPSMNDSTMVQINPLENITTKVKNVMDLLKTNPECLELNELVINAKKAINSKEYDVANSLLDEAMRSCRFITSKLEEEKLQEKPSPQLTVWLAVGIAAVITSSAAFLYFTRRKNIRPQKKKEGAKEKEEANEKAKEETTEDTREETNKEETKEEVI